MEPPALFLISILLCTLKNTAQMGSEGGDKLDQLRNEMSASGIQAYIVTSADDHQSEYTGLKDRRREYVSGFSGSVGDATITLNKAALWVDSRYYIQAEKEVSSSWTVYKIKNKKESNSTTSQVPTMESWFIENLKSGDTVGADPKTFLQSRWKDLALNLTSQGMKLTPLEVNLVDKIWKDRPPMPDGPIYSLDLEFSGVAREDKIKDVRKTLKSGDMLVVSNLDDIAWLLNLRGSDIPYTPVFYAYVILSLNTVNLYVNSSKMSSELQDNLQKNGSIKILPYEQFWSDLNSTSRDYQTVYLPKSVSQKIYAAVSDKEVKFESPIMQMKALKNDVEIKGMRNAHIRDAVALCEMMYILEKEIPENKTWDEIKVADKLESLRNSQENNKGLSFQSIVAFGENAALPHYTPTKDTNKNISGSGLLKIDSGGQYLDGTIDTTRTLLIGTATDEQISIYTALLKGVADLATTVFPSGIEASKLEFIIRRPLYQLGYTFGHGTTHGTGHFLSVHESFNGRYYNRFIGSQEPGYYRKDSFGMRLENLVVVVPATAYDPEEDTLLTFDELTLVPYETSLININALDQNELRWLNNYHKKVREQVGDEMKRQKKETLYNWLLTKTKNITKTNG